MSGNHFPGPSPCPPSLPFPPLSPPCRFLFGGSVWGPFSGTEPLVRRLESGLPRWLSGREPARQVGDVGSIPGSGRSPGGGNGDPLQDSCLGNPRDRGAWWVTGPGSQKSRAQLNSRACRREMLSTVACVVHRGLAYGLYM